MAEPKRKKRPADLNQRAKSIVDELTGQTPDEPESHHAAAGRLGGLKGGAARREKLTAEQRAAIARNAAAARWRKNEDTAT